MNFRHSRYVTVDLISPNLVRADWLETQKQKQAIARERAQLLRQAIPPQLDLIGVYETRNSRQLDKAIAQLMTLQQARAERAEITLNIKDK